MNILVTLIIGGIAGWLAGLLYKGGGFGVIGNIIVGLVGSVIGYLVFNLLGLSADGNWGYLVTATIGALILLTIVNIVKKPA